MICLKSGKHGRDIFDFQQASSGIENWGHGGTNCHNHFIVYENDKDYRYLQFSLCESYVTGLEIHNIK